MTSSRRHFLRSLGMGTAAGAAAMRWPLETISAAQSAEPIRPNGADGFLLLNSNENPYGPSARVANAIRGATGKVNRYAFLKYDQVTEQIANHHRVKPERILFGCGSTELLRVAACAFLGNSKKLIQALPTFEALENYAKSLGSEVTHVHIDRKFAHDLEGMLSHADASTGLVYICNPNNPTASLTPRKDIEAFVRRLPATTHVLIDEAYHDYVISTGMYSSFIDNPMDDDRVIVTRTFSKVHGLAGLRLGYAVAAPEVIEKMRAFLTQDSLNSIVAEVVGVALDDVSGVREAVKRNHDDMQEFLNRAVTRNLSPIDTHTNFVMMNIQHPAPEVIDHFKQRRILIGRYFPSMETYIRVSMGTPKDMQTFWQAWNLLPWSNKKMHH
jgi:histidinol-phosphate aminotransferase